MYHDADLVCASLEDALRNNDAPDIAHTDQGYEYLSQKNSKLCEQMNIEMSASDKGEPWQNYYYNYERIHTALKMPLKAYALKLQETNLLQDISKKVPKMNASHSLRLPQSAYAN